MTQSFFLLGFCLVINIMIIVIFLGKKRLPLFENDIYKYLLYMNFLCIILEFFCNLAASGVFYSNRQIIVRLFLISLMFYGAFLTIYTLIVAIDDQKKNRIIARLLLFSTIILCFPIIFLDIDFLKYHDLAYASGSAINYIVTVLSVYTLIAVILLIVKKRFFQKKFIPIFAYIVLMMIAILINKTDPTIAVINCIETFVILLMYHTIENPDMKLIEQLEVAREQADKANRAKTDFLSSMSHEIRTPLNAIVGFSDCIMDSNTLGEAKENAHDIINASQTLLEIVNGILDISKIEAGKIEIVNSKYNALDTFEELAKLITPKMNEKGLDFTYKIAPDLPKTLFGDHANIKKVVTNLLSNACKYTEHGFVHYEVNCINTKDVCKLIISVEDSGRGIKKDSIDKLFTKFQRLDEDKNTTIEGTGLGLAITKQLIELMGGRIIVHTVYGEGSKFTVVLNQKITTEEVVNKKKVKDTLDLHDIRILMVDDTPLNLKVACKLLERYNANHIVTCNSGFECIERIKRGEVYDILLLDDMMPKMSGVETLKILKAIPGFCIPTVALTANAITGMREKYLADGFDDYLAKPIEKEQLIQVFNQILGRSITEEIEVDKVALSSENTPNIRGEEIPKVEDYDTAEQERLKKQIIPVEDNIEEILGNQLDRNYQEEEVKLNDIPIELHHFDDHEDEFVSTDGVFDKDYLIEQGVDIEEALSLLGDMDMYNMTIHDFYRDVEDKWNNIVHYKDEGNMSEYSVLVHSLKSDCKYLGFMKLADISYQHELKSKENDLNFVLEHFRELEDEYHKSIEIIKNYVEHNPVNE